MFSKVINYQNLNWRFVASHPFNEAPALNKALFYNSRKQTICLAAFTVACLGLFILTYFVDRSAPKGYAAFPGVSGGLLSLFTMYEFYKTFDYRKKIREDQRQPNHPYLRDLLDRDGCTISNERRMPPRNVDRFIRGDLIRNARRRPPGHFKAHRSIVERPDPGIEMEPPSEGSRAPRSTPRTRHLPQPADASMLVPPDPRLILASSTAGPSPQGAPTPNDPVGEFHLPGAALPSIQASP